MVRSGWLTCCWALISVFHVTRYNLLHGACPLGKIGWVDTLTLLGKIGWVDTLTLYVKSGSTYFAMSMVIHQLTDILAFLTFPLEMGTGELEKPLDRRKDCLRTARRTHNAFFLTQSQELWNSFIVFQDRGLPNHFVVWHAKIIPAKLLVSDIVIFRQRVLLCYTIGNAVGSWIKELWLSSIIYNKKCYEKHDVNGVGIYIYLYFDKILFIKKNFVEILVNIYPSIFTSCFS